MYLLGIVFLQVSNSVFLFILIIKILWIIKYFHMKYGPIMKINNKKHVYSSQKKFSYKSLFLYLSLFAYTTYQTEYVLSFISRASK